MPTHSRWPKRIRRSYAIQPSDVLVGTIARLFELKGHDDLLDIAPDLCARFPRLKFMWVGDGLLRRKFEERIALTAVYARDAWLGAAGVRP